MRPPSAAQSRAVAVAPAPRGFPVVACLESIARGTRCLLLTHTSIIGVSRNSRRPSETGDDDMTTLAIVQILVAFVAATRARKEAMKPALIVIGGVALALLLSGCAQRMLLRDPSTGQVVDCTSSYQSQSR